MRMPHSNEKRGAKLAASAVAPARLKEVESLCPYCGVGCALTFVVDEEKNKILYTKGRDGAANSERLCVKGRYGFDYAMHAQRLTVPLIRRESSYPKGALSPMTQSSTGGYKKGKERKPGGLVDYRQVMPHFREATWDEALDLIASRLK